MPRRTQVHRRPRRALLATAALGLALASTTTAPSAGASVSCGTYNYSFVGTRLLNDGISDSAGPYSIQLPAGTYDVTMRSYDFHSTQDNQIGQEAERWWFALDSGWRSIATHDLPDDEDWIVTTMTAQDVPASTAISVHHFGQGGVNSIEPICVGFTPTDDGPQDPGDPGDDDPGDDTPEPGPGDDPGRIPDDPSDPDDDPDRAIPDDPGDPADPGDPGEPGGNDPGPDPGSGDDPGTIPDDPGDEPERRIPDEPGDPDDPGDDPERSPDEPVIPELAITGASTVRLIGIAIVLLHVGGLFLFADRQRSLQESRRSSSG